MQIRPLRNIILLGLVAATPALAQDYPRADDPRRQPDSRPYAEQRQVDRDAQRDMDAQRREEERRDGEANRDQRRYEARVTSVHAVLGEGEQRCWVEREQVAQSDRRDPNVAGAVVGAIVGGVLGHQVGSGRGRDVATVGGAAAGGLLGANVGRGGDNDRVVDRDVQRCRQTRRDAQPDFYDVTYRFRGQEHRAQLSFAPGETIAVNRDGEPL